MNYAIIRNTNYKIKNLNGIYRHNERKNTNYSNKDIIQEKSRENYSLKKATSTYQKMFHKIKEKYNLKGQIKNVSNVACEYIITASKEFFENIGEEKTKKFFKAAYSFVCNYKQLGEQYILSAKVHMDESTPHMHVVFIPVVHTKDKKGNEIDKIACSEFWKGKNSYQYLQDNFHQYINTCGFNLERGKEKENQHLNIEQLKSITNYERIKEEIEKTPIQEATTNSLEAALAENKKIVKHCNRLREYCIKGVKAVEQCEEYEIKIKNITEENINLKKRINKLNTYIKNIFNILYHKFKISKERLEEITEEIKTKRLEKDL